MYGVGNRWFYVVCTQERPVTKKIHRYSLGYLQARFPKKIFKLKIRVKPQQPGEWRHQALYAGHERVGIRRFGHR